MTELATESLLAAGYGLFLAAAALGLDLMAKHSHRRSDVWRTGGFTYHGHLDAWECPEGERLHRIETDMHQRLARYRARAHVCNNCPRKHDCTDSESGREVTRNLDPWPHSEAGRFHRVIAAAIVGFGILVIGAGAALNHGPADLAVLGGALLLCTIAGLHLVADLRSTGSGFPWPEGERSGAAPAPPAQPERSASSTL
jgi:Transposase DDE domain